MDEKFQIALQELVKALESGNYDNPVGEIPLYSEPIVKSKKCTCGSEKCGSPAHSSWCDLNQDDN